MSIAALGVSIPSCVVSRDAQKQASTEFREARELVLTGEFEAPNKVECSFIKVTSLSG
jgi:hypothetical protein